MAAAAYRLLSAGHIVPGGFVTPFAERWARRIGFSISSAPESDLNSLSRTAFWPNALRAACGERRSVSPGATTANIPRDGNVHGDLE